MANKEDLLKPFHEQIVQWRAQNISYTDITKNLEQYKVNAGRSTVYNYCVLYRLTDPAECLGQIKEASQPSAENIGTPKEEPAVPIHNLSAVQSQWNFGVTGTTTVNQTKPIPIPNSFPDIDVYRARILDLTSQGCGLSHVLPLLQALGVKCDESRVREYLESLYHFLSPPGKVAPHLYEIEDQTKTWKSDTPLIRFSQNDADTWKLSDFYQGTLILGATGSGKTTGSGWTLARIFLALGCGGLIVTTKPGEFQEWVKLAHVTGRLADIAIIGPGSYLRIDALAYETQRPGEASKQSENLMYFIQNLVSILSLKKSPSMNGEFWQKTGNQLLRNMLDCFIAADEPVTIDQLAKFLINAPTSEEAADKDNWYNLPVFGEILGRVQEKATTPELQQIYETQSQYWLHFYPQIPHETRACINVGFAAMIDSLRSPHIRNLVAKQTTITPECILNGKIIILDMPINEHHESGLLVQSIWKYLFQRAVIQRRDIKNGERCLPVFLWEDEAHNFISDYDSEFTRVSRDRRLIRVMISQNINNFYDVLGGGDYAHVKTNSILGNLNTRIFHTNGDLITNEWASKLLGSYEKHYTETSTTPARSQSLNPVTSFVYEQMKKPSVATTTHTHRDPNVFPHDFSTLIPGGPKSGFMTQAYITQVGRVHSDGKPFLKVHFQQLILDDSVLYNQETNNIAKTKLLEPATPEEQ